MVLVRERFAALKQTTSLEEPVRRSRSVITLSDLAETLSNLETLPAKSRFICRKRFLDYKLPGIPQETEYEILRNGNLKWLTTHRAIGHIRSRAAINAITMASNRRTFEFPIRNQRVSENFRGRSSLSGKQKKKAK